MISNINIIGNVEIHVKASDFRKHKHQNDKAYSNIILHVVYENDEPIDFPTLELKNFLSDKTIETYSTLLFKKSELACNTLLHHLPELNKNLLLDASGIERLNIKTDLVDSVVIKYTRLVVYLQFTLYENVPPRPFLSLFITDLRIRFHRTNPACLRRVNSRRRRTEK